MYERKEEREKIGTGSQFLIKYFNVWLRSNDINNGPVSQRSFNTFKTKTYPTFRLSLARKKE